MMTSSFFVSRNVHGDEDEEYRRLQV